MSECPKCKYKLLTMAGVIELQADTEPYKADVLESADTPEADQYLTALFCEKCEKIVGVWSENGDDLSLQSQLAASQKEARILREKHLIALAEAQLQGFCHANYGGSTMKII